MDRIAALVLLNRWGCAMPDRPLIEVRDLWKSFAGQPVLRGVDLAITEGTSFVILGASASGKTVLLKHLLGLMQPDRGSVLIDGEDLSKLDPLGFVRLHRKIGIAFQAGALFDGMTVFDNVAFPLRERAHLSEPDVAAAVHSVLALLELDGMANAYPAELSGGMRKRVAVARAISDRPKILFFDEPTAGLDPLTTTAVADELLFVRQRLGLTVLTITHDLRTAFAVADRVALLHEGVLVAEDTPARFLASTHPAVVQFLHEWRTVREAAEQL